MSEKEGKEERKEEEAKMDEVERRVEAGLKYLESLEVRDLEIVGYEGQGKIKMEMAV